MESKHASTEAADAGEGIKMFTQSGFAPAGALVMLRSTLLRAVYTCTVLYTCVHVLQYGQFPRCHYERRGKK